MKQIDIFIINITKLINFIYLYIIDNDICTCFIIFTSYHFNDRKIMIK